MTERIPRLAIMGHPNAGKSSVVATLTENDSVPIDKRAGTTTESDVYPVTIDGRVIIEFVDTPGFQNPNLILEWFQEHDDEPDLARAFLAAHAHDPLLAHDCALLRPVAEGAGIILVLDGSKRIKEKDRVEIELLRLTARPRMAILNNLSSESRYLEKWQDALGKSFNSVREFNAHRATYSERIRLLNALKSIDQRWEPMLENTIDAFERDWARRVDLAAGTITELIEQALTFTASKTVFSARLVFDKERERIEASLAREFEDGLRQLENTAQSRIREHFKHNVWHVPLNSVLGQDLLSEEVEKRLGLSRRQMLTVGAAAGAVSGVALDAATLGASFGAFALAGGLAGGALGAIGSRALAKLNIEKASGRETFTIGPVSNPRFPFVLLDRIVLYSARAMNWAHGRQAADEAAADRVPEREFARQGFTEALPAPQQRELGRFFAAVRKGKSEANAAEIRQIVQDILRGLSLSEIDARAHL